MPKDKKKKLKAKDDKRAQKAQNEKKKKEESKAGEKKTKTKKKNKAKVERQKAADKAAKKKSAKKKRSKEEAKAKKVKLSSKAKKAKTAPENKKKPSKAKAKKTKTKSKSKKAKSAMVKAKKKPSKEKKEKAQSAPVKEEEKTPAHKADEGAENDAAHAAAPAVEDSPTKVVPRVQAATSAAKPLQAPAGVSAVLRRVIETPLGRLSLKAEGEALTEILFTEEDLGGDDAPLLQEAERQLAEYFVGERKSFELPLALRGTEFQRAVYDALLAIPYGEVKSYQEVAVAIGRDRAYRAVGGAVGKNPLTVVVPCHRVVRKDGSAGGYSGGAHRKEALLRLEGR